MEEEDHSSISLQAIELAHKLKTDKSSAVVQEVAEYAKTNDMIKWYETLKERHGLEPLPQLTDHEAKVKKALEDCEEAIKDAEENHGESEVCEALKKKACYLSTIGDLAEAKATLAKVRKTTKSQGINLSMVLLTLEADLCLNECHIDVNLLNEGFELADLVSDWDRRNALKVFRALEFLNKGESSKALALLMEIAPSYPATFFDTRVFCLILTYAAVLAASRADIKKMLATPEIALFLRAVPECLTMFQAISTGAYDLALATFWKVDKALLHHPLTSHHLADLAARVHFLCYSLYLKPYHNVSLDAMAEAFKLPRDRVEKDLVFFITAGKLMYQIDKTKGLIFSKASQNTAGSNSRDELMEQGDALLNRLQHVSHYVAV